jgi:hypothetical protein
VTIYGGCLFWRAQAVTPKAFWQKFECCVNNKGQNKERFEAVASPQFWVQSQTAVATICRKRESPSFEIQKRRQRFICAYHEAVSVALLMNSEHHAKASASRDHREMNRRLFRLGNCF